MLGGMRVETLDSFRFILHPSDPSFGWSADNKETITRVSCFIIIYGMNFISSSYNAKENTIQISSISIFANVFKYVCSYLLLLLHI